MPANLLSGSYEVDLEEVWENERTATPIRAFAVHLHQTDCLLREETTILAELGVERSYGAVWNWCIGWLTADATRRQRRRCGSLSTEPLSRSVASNIG